MGYCTENYCYFDNNIFLLGKYFISFFSQAGDRSPPRSQARSTILPTISCLQSSAAQVPRSHQQFSSSDNAEGCGEMRPGFNYRLRVFTLGRKRLFSCRLQLPSFKQSRRQRKKRLEAVPFKTKSEQEKDRQE